jgi:hypothetical protein
MIVIDDLDDLSVVHAGDAIGKFKDARIMCYYDERPVRAFGSIS